MFSHTTEQAKSVTLCHHGAACRAAREQSVLEAEALTGPNICSTARHGGSYWHVAFAVTKRASGSTSDPATWTRPTYLILWVDSRRANLQAHGHTEHRCLLCLQLHAAQRAHASPRLPRKTSRLAKALHKALTNRRRQRGRMKLVSYIFYGQVFLRCFPGVQTAARCTRGRR